MNGTSRTVSIIDTGVANVASVCAAFRRLNFESQLTQSAEVIAESDFVVLPGVGSFSAGMTRLHQLNVVDAIQQRIAKRQPTLAICLGMQLLCSGSEESPQTAGLGIFPFKATRLPQDVTVPQLGWNRVMTVDESLIPSGTAYFANSFCLAAAPENWSIARTDYGIKFVSACWDGPVLACQFHPELSGHWGQQLLATWLNRMQPQSVAEVSGSC